jgi:hypothetical protein
MPLDDIKRAKVKRVLKQLAATGSDDPEPARAVEAKLRSIADYARDNADRLGLSTAEVNETVDRLRGMIEGQRYAVLAREQINPMQEMLGGALLSLTGNAAGAAALLADAGARMAAGEPFGGIADLPRVSVGCADALAGKPPEATDVGYLAAYCDMVIQLDEEQTP